jgi:hypothetical protein
MTAEIVTFPRAVTPATRNLVRAICKEELDAKHEPIARCVYDGKLYIVVFGDGAKILSVSNIGHRLQNGQIVELEHPVWGERCSHRICKLSDKELDQIVEAARVMRGRERDYEKERCAAINQLHLRRAKLLAGADKTLEMVALFETAVAS